MKQPDYWAKMLDDYNALAAAASEMERELAWWKKFASRLAMLNIVWVLFFAYLLW